MGEYGSNIWGNSKKRFVYNCKLYAKIPATGGFLVKFRHGGQNFGIMIRNFFIPAELSGGNWDRKIPFGCKVDDTCLPNRQKLQAAHYLGRRAQKAGIAAPQHGALPNNPHYVNKRLWQMRCKTMG